MSDVKIILLNGKANSGKDTYYKSYLEEFGEKEYIVRFAFADAIKDIMKEYFGWDGKNKEGIRRSQMQAIGNFFRSIDDKVWVDYLEREIRGYINYHIRLGGKDVTVFLTDLRFMNEVLRMKELFPDYKVIVKRLHREFESCLNNAQQNDISEHGINDDLVDEEIYLENHKGLI